MSESEVTADAAIVNAEADAPEEEVVVNPNFKWYVVNTYSGYENKAKLALEKRIEQFNLTEEFGDILIPTETVETVRDGQRRKVTRKFFPGYMIVQMELNDKTWHLVKSTPKVTGFVGNATKPMPIRQNEVDRLTKQITEGVKKVVSSVLYIEGDQVRVTDGPFANFSGSVEEVNADKQKVKVLVSIFGRSQAIELDFAEVEKAR